MYLRNFSLQVGTNGSGLELSPNPATMPKATFHTYQHNKETPNHAQIRVYNLSTQTVQQIQQEFSQVVLSAGYIDSPFGQIFNGNIVQVKVGYENMGGVDSYIEIIAADGDLGYAISIASVAVSKGSTYQTRLNALMAAANNTQGSGTTGGTGLGGLSGGSGPGIGGLSSAGGTSGAGGLGGGGTSGLGSLGGTGTSGLGSTGTTGTAGTGSQGTTQLSLGYVDTLPQGTLPRGRVYYGMWRDHMRDFAASTGMDWWIQDSKVNLLGKGNVLPGTATVITSKTGLIGWPEQTEQGIKIRSLLNPSLKPGNLITIQNSQVNQATLGTNYTSTEQNAQLPGISSNGQYKIIVVEHFGDTRGNEWYTDLTCLAYPITFIPESLANAGYTF